MSTSLGGFGGQIYDSTRALASEKHPKINQNFTVSARNKMQAPHEKHSFRCSTEHVK